MRRDIGGAVLVLAARLGVTAMWQPRRMVWPAVE